MRNGKTLLRLVSVMVVIAMLCMASVFVFGSTQVEAAPALEDTDSGAPSAIVMFPVSEKPNPTGAGLKPVVFNHLIHESKIDDCEVCHHTGDMVTCSSCHTVEGSEDGNYVTLERAMHATEIAKRETGTPSSCISCHNTNLKRLECAGCHSIIMPTAEPAYSNCAPCHSVNVTKEQMISGSAGTLSVEENEELAAQAVYEKSTTYLISSRAIPDSVIIDSIADEYEPTVFTHGTHVDYLMQSIKDDKLAAAFHNDPAILCAACHHNSPFSATPPKCSSCHAAAIDPAVPERPALKAAYHLQCMGCHTAMNLDSPKNTSCNTCHKERAK